MSFSLKASRVVVKKYSIKRPRTKAGKKTATRRSERMAKKRKVSDSEKQTSTKETESCQDQNPGISQAPTTSKDSPFKDLPSSVLEDKAPSPVSNASQSKDQEDADDDWMDQSSDEEDPPRQKSKVKEKYNLFINS